MKNDKPKTYLNPNDSIIKLLEDKLSYHEEQISFHREEMKEIREIITMMKTRQTLQLGNLTVKSFHEPSLFQYGEEKEINPEYKQRVFWSKTSVDYIKKCGILVRSSDIFTSVGISATDKERRSIMSTLSLALADLCEEGKLKKFNVEGVKGYYYGTPEMFNGEKPIVEY